MRLRLLLSSFIILSCSLAAHASLIGDSVKVRYLSPSTNVVQDFGTQTVTNGLTDSVLSDISLTFSANQITITNLAPGVFFPSDFNGFDVALLSGSPFTSVTYDVMSSAIFRTGSVLSFTSSDIRLNVAGTCTTCTGGGPDPEVILRVHTDAADLVGG